MFCDNIYDKLDVTKLKWNNQKADMVSGAEIDTKKY